MHNLNYLLHDEVFYKQKNYFTLSDLKKLLVSSGYENIIIYSWYQNKNRDEEKLLNLFNYDYLNYEYYTFKAMKKDT